jgi:hypothetical protein
MGQGIIAYKHKVQYIRVMAGIENFIDQSVKDSHGLDRW